VRIARIKGTQFCTFITMMSGTDTLIRHSPQGNFDGVFRAGRGEIVLYLPEGGNRLFYAANMSQTLCDWHLGFSACLE
jgi:hypothetical protein